MEHDVYAEEWPVVRKILVRNRLEGAALLAKGLKISDQQFMRMAYIAYRAIEHKIDSTMEAQQDLEEAQARAAAQAADENLSPEDHRAAAVVADPPPAPGVNQEIHDDIAKDPPKTE